MEMKTILFICRSELTDLYVELGNRLKDRFHILYAAYNHADEERMKTRFHTEPDLVFTDRLKEHLSHIPTADELRELDRFIMKWSDERFSLNSVIQSDRTYAGMSYPDVLVNLHACWSVWNEVFTSRKISYVFHEPVSLAFNQMAELNCKANGGRYLTMISCFGRYKYSYLFLDAGNAKCPELMGHFGRICAGKEDFDREEAVKFIAAFRQSFEVLAACGFKKEIPSIEFLARGAGHWVKEHFQPDQAPRIEDTVDYFLKRQNPNWNRLKNKRDYAKKVVYDQADEKDRYYFYSFHLEPEAVVLYWGDGLYTNQVKLIENIAGQLPPGTYLYVKDHPHYLYYRDVNDYLRLKKIPNVKLLAPEIPGKMITKNAIGVFSINATAGFESIMLQKQAYIFGNAFYSCCPLVTTLRNIRDLRGALYDRKPWSQEDEELLIRFTAALLKSTHEGVTCFFSGMAQKYPIDQKKNLDDIALAVGKLDAFLEKEAAEEHR